MSLPKSQPPPADDLDRVIARAAASPSVSPRVRQWLTALACSESAAGVIERPQPAPPAKAAG